MTTLSVPTASAPVRGGLSLALWGVQLTLGLVFFGLGVLKLTQPVHDLLDLGMTFVARTPEGLVRFIGLSELLGGIGLVAPAATRFLPWLTPVAAAALGLVMVLAAGEHVANGEIGHLPGSLVFGGLLAFVAWGRGARLPIPARA